MAKELIARGQVTIVTQQEAYTIIQSLGDYIFPAENTGVISNAVTITSTVKVTQADIDFAGFSIGPIPKPAGFSAITVNNNTKTITYSIAANTADLADSGVISIPVIINGVAYSLSFSWSKAKKGDTGPAGTDANLLDWVKDWDTNKTVIGAGSVITPRIFAGVKNSNGTLTGMAIGKFPLSTLDAAGQVATETINGIYGFRDGYKTFSVDSGGNAQLGKGNQFIKYNAATGKIEFGSDVSLNWTAAANNALASAKSYADTKKTEAISAAATDAAAKANEVKTIARQANDLAGRKVRYIRDWLNGSTANTGNHWVQVMACDKDGNNIALNKDVSGASSDKRVTNGDTGSDTYVSGGTGLKHITVDLGAVYDISYIRVWHYYSDGRTYNDTKTECSVDGLAWFVIFDSSTEGTYKELPGGITHYVSEYDRATRKTLKAQETADAITKEASDEKWGAKLTYIDANGIFTGTLSANTVNAVKINASQITAGTIDTARLNTDALKASLVTAANIEALTLNVVRGKIGGWSIDADAVFSGTKNNTVSAYTAAAGAITIGSNGIRGFKWRLDSNGTGAIAGGNISWDAAGNVTFGSSVSLNWTNAASNALASAKTYADTKKTEAVNAAATDAATKANQAKTDAINAAAADATNKVNGVVVGGRNLIRLANIGGTADAGKFNDNTGRFRDISAAQWRIQNWTTSRAGQYSLSFWAKADVAGKLSIDTCDQNGKTIDLTATWQFFKFENLAVTAYLTSPYYGFLDFNRISGSTIKDLYLSNLKLEYGTKCTDYTKAPEDIESGIADARTAGTNAQAVADAITKKANDEKWANKLTYIDANGIFTGTLSANTVNAIKIDATQITAGTIDAARINVAALKTSLITAANIDALTLNVTKGNIGGWNIGADNITTGSLNVVGQTPIQIRSTSAGSGNVYNGAFKPYGITLSWYQSSNAGHIGLGQVLATGTTVKTGFMGIQMMAWDSTEYFCLSANTAKSGAKEVYNRIAGWAFDNDSIFRGTKNNTAAAFTAGAGSITIGSNGIRGFKWRLDGTGAGAVAGGNIAWDASGNVTFASSVSLNWTNAANNALASAKTYADTKKTEAINSAATDATNKSNAAKTDSVIYCRGTGNNRTASRILTISGNSIYNSTGRGLQVTVIKRSDLSVVSNVCYDVYGDANKRTEIANALNALNDTVIVVITSYDAIVIDTPLATAMIRCGSAGLNLNGRYPYAFIGIPGTGNGSGIEICQGLEASAPYAEISTKIVSGIPQGINSVQRISLENALGGAAYPKLTKIDSTGIYTGTLTADQINAGTISADRIAAGSLDASKLDAASIKAGIINTDYINGLTCTFVRGKIGGWSIGSDTITVGTVGGAGAMPIQFRSSSTGSGYVYSGQYKPYGLTMTWHQSNNAGHFVFGQVMATGNSVKTGFIGIQMMSWDNQEYFCLAANYTKSGAKDFYNRIAGWAFDNDSIYRGTKNNSASAYTAASGSITIGSNGIRGFKWRLDSTGAGAMAGGNITWDAAGNVTFGSSVSLNWTNAANNALTSAKSYADTKKTEAINAAATDATTKSEAAKELALAMAFGKMLYRDPVFYNGNNGVNVYNNSNNGTVTITRASDSTAPNDSKQVLVIKNTGTANPNCGGFHWSTTTSYRKIFITRIIAKIPAGRNIGYHSNSIGTGGSQKWLTPTAGTGEWCEYICKVICGTASFSSTHFFAITGAVGTATAPVEWRIAYATVFDNTSTEKYTTTIDANGIYTGTIRANQIMVDSALVVGGSTYNGSISVRDAANGVKVTLDRNGITAVGGTIGGWAIASNQISKNSVILGSDGTISNGTRWKLANDGSGYVANSNISWTADGAVTITGTVNATSGAIGGFTISGNKLTNKAADSAIIFGSLSGDSHVSINESTYTLLAMRADSARTAISIQTYAAGARGISIIANAGSAYAIESYGPHVFGQRAGEKWNAPGVLFSAVVKNSGTLYNQWGNGLGITSFSKTGTGYYTCRHNLGHTQYTVIAAPYWDSGSNWHGNCFIRTEYINANEFSLRVVNADNGKAVDTCLTFAVIGRNKL